MHTAMDRFHSICLRTTALCATIVLAALPIGCSKRLHTDEYVPFILDDLNRLGVFDEAPAVAHRSISKHAVPPSWRLDESVHVTWSPSTIGLSPKGSEPKFVYRHSGRLYSGSARIAVVKRDNDGFFEILVAAQSGVFPSPVHTGNALIHARNRDDYVIVASAGNERDLDSHSLVILQELTRWDYLSQPDRAPQ